MRQLTTQKPPGHIRRRPCGADGTLTGGPSMTPPPRSSCAPPERPPDAGPGQCLVRHGFPQGSVPMDCATSHHPPKASAAAMLHLGPGWRRSAGQESLRGWHRHCLPAWQAPGYPRRPLPNIDDPITNCWLSRRVQSRWPGEHAATGSAQICVIVGEAVDREPASARSYRAPGGTMNGWTDAQMQIAAQTVRHEIEDSRLAHKGDSLVHAVEFRQGRFSTDTFDETAGRRRRHAASTRGAARSMHTYPPAGRRRRSRKRVGHHTAVRAAARKDSRWPSLEFTDPMPSRLTPKSLAATRDGSS